MGVTIDYMSAVIEGFIPPHSIEAEMCALGAMFLSERAREQVREILKDEDFYRPAHRTIFETMVNLMEKGSAVDLMTVRAALQDKGLLQSAGGVEYLINVAEAVPSAANASDYAQIVREKSVLRRLEEAGHKIISVVHDTDSDAQQKVDESERMIHEISRREMRNSLVSVSQATQDFRTEVDELYESGAPILGHPSGFYDLDKMTGGMYGSDLTILAARPAMGKSALAMGIASHVAQVDKGAVAVFSLEMSTSQLVRRMVSSRSQLSTSLLKKPNLSDNNYEKLIDACEHLYSLPIFIDDNAEISPFEMRSKCRRLQSEHGLSLVVVDYLQLMKSSRKTENRVQEVSEIARALKVMAKELNVPVIALSQLSRQVEQRPDKRPMLSDIRESGSIEAEADLVMFIYRDAYYKAKEEGAPEQDYNPEAVEEAELIIAKHRSGPTGKVILGFQPAYARFVNLKR